MTDEARELPPPVEGEKIVQVAVGGWHAAFLDERGRVFTSGTGSSGQLGHGDREPRGITFVAALGEIAWIAAGQVHTVAIDAAGRAYVFGNGAITGAFGLGKRAHCLLPTLVPTPARWTQAAAGTHHTVLLDETGSVWACGEGSFGELGLGDVARRAEPTRLPAFSAAPIAQVCAADGFSAFIDALGKVYVCGNGEDGQLGLGDSQNCLIPTLVAALEGATIVQVAASGSHTAFLDSEGRVYTCGYGKDGQLGLGDRRDRPDPAPVSAPVHTVGRITQIAACAAHTLMLNNFGEVYACGRGIGRFTPETAKISHDVVVKIAAGREEAFLVDRRGDVYQCTSDKEGGLRCSRSPLDFVVPRRRAGLC